MDSYTDNQYNQFMDHVASCPNSTAEYLSHLWDSVYQSDWQNRFSEPMPLIGMYIAVASLLCILAMAADLFHGFRNRKLWFPCKYFTLNAASLTVIAVAIKLPMDLTNLMPGYVDQVAKLGSLSFMCTMMANLLPSLATMESKELVTNMIALGVLVITLVVNVCIQMNTGVLSYHVVDVEFRKDVYGGGVMSFYSIDQSFFANIYVAFLLMLLIIYACSSLAILKSKQILESKYQEAHQTALEDEDLQGSGRWSIQKLKKHVSNYWIMAETGSPQFMTACSATTSASGVICALSTCINLFIMPLPHIGSKSEYKSNYKWSVVVICVVQLIGVVVGTIAPLSRCFAALSFKLSIKWIWKHMKVSKVESYWTQKLSDWKQSSILCPFGSRKYKVFIQSLKVLILNICIGFQMIVVVSCKIISAVPIFFVICVLYCSRFWKRLKAMCGASGIVLVQEELDKDLSRYVLQLQDDMEFPERTLKSILKSVNNLIHKAEKQPPVYLMKLLEESRGFEGVEKFDSHLVPPLLTEEYPNSWSLPLVTLTTIALSLPNIQKNIVDSLLCGVSEGLVYVALVEESFNVTQDHVSIQKEAKTLWLEVEVYHKWFGNKLQKHIPQANTAGQILHWLKDIAKNMVIEVESLDNDSSKWKSISANSMYRIIETILLTHNTDIDEVSQEELFAELSSIVADILAACLTNLAQVIAMKCHTSAIEKREASVQAAAQLLGETTKIINTLQERELPSLNLDELAFIDKWRAYLKDPFP